MDSMTYSSEGSPTTLVRHPQVSHHQKDASSGTPAAVVNPVVPASMLAWLNDDSDSEATSAAAAWDTPLSSSGVSEPAKIGSHRDKTRGAVAAAAAAAAARNTVAEEWGEKALPPPYDDDSHLQRGEVVVESLTVSVPAGSQADRKQEDFQPPSPAAAEEGHDGTAVVSAIRFPDPSPDIAARVKGCGGCNVEKDTRTAQQAAAATAKIVEVYDATNNDDPPAVEIEIVIESGEEADRPTKQTLSAREMEHWLSHDSEEELSTRAGSGSGMRLGGSIGNGALQDDEIFRWGLFFCGVQVALLHRSIDVPLQSSVSGATRTSRIRITV